VLNGAQKGPQRRPQKRALNQKGQALQWVHRPIIESAGADGQITRQRWCGERWKLLKK
jgi:hypothetical protein